MEERKLFPNKVMYGNAYVPNQNLKNLYSLEEGLSNGTMFPELVNIYNPGQAMEINRYLKENRREMR